MELGQLKAAVADVDQRYLAFRGAVEIRNRVILAAYHAGASQAELAIASGLSPQRIHQLVYDAEPEGVA